MTPCCFFRKSRANLPFLLNSPEQYDSVVVSVPDTSVQVSVMLDVILPSFSRQVLEHSPSEALPPQGVDLQVTGEYSVKLAIRQEGDRNLIWFNVLICISRMKAYYRELPATVAFARHGECLIQRGFYLEGYAKLARLDQEGLCEKVGYNQSASTSWQTTAMI